MRMIVEYLVLFAVTAMAQWNETPESYRNEHGYGNDHDNDHDDDHGERLKLKIIFFFQYLL